VVHHAGSATAVELPVGVGRVVVGGVVADLIREVLFVGYDLCSDPWSALGK
jgi:hypothetical protein